MVGPRLMAMAWMIAVTETLKVVSIAHLMVDLKENLKKNLKVCQIQVQSFFDWHLYVYEAP